MHSHQIDHIPFHPDADDLESMLHIASGSKLSFDFRQFLQETMAVARPKAMYRVAAIDSKSEETVMIEGAVFTSRVLRVNLENANRVFPFVATCGVELEQWGHSQSDMLKRFWADAIEMTALKAAMESIREHIDQHYRPKRLSMMNPGSLSDWPLREQRVLFRLLGDPHEAIGVELKQSLMMAPAKSASGLFFPLEESFESCQLCPMPNCPSRRAPYDATLYARKYGTPDNS